MSDNSQKLSEIVTIKQPIDEGTRRWQLGSADIVETIRQQLRGYHFDESKRSWIKISEPWANDEGISRFSSIISFYLNKNVQLSYLEPEIIENITVQFGNELSEYFRFYYRQFGVPKETAGMLFHMLVDIVYAALMRARFGKESQFIENTEQRSIIQQEGQKQEQGNIFSKIPILGGKR